MPISSAVSAGDDATASQYNNALLDMCPAGTVLPFAGASVPSGYGWLLCYGQAISRTTYSDLFDIVGETYGVGDGSTTFNLPDMRGNVPLGKDDMGGASRNRVTATEADSLGGEEGEEEHTLITAEMPAHVHRQRVSTNSGIGYVNDGSGQDAGESGQDTSSTGGGGAHNNMQPYVTLNYIIKY